jgi:hypothetical protein
MFRVPQKSKSKGYKSYLQPRLGDPGRYHRFIFEATDSNDNVLSIDSIQDMFNVRSKLEEVTAEHRGKTVRLPDLCWRNERGSNCTTSASPLESLSISPSCDVHFNRSLHRYLQSQCTSMMHNPMRVALASYDGPKSRRLSLMPDLCRNS